MVTVTENHHRYTESQEISDCQLPIANWSSSRASGKSAIGNWQSTILSVVGSSSRYRRLPTCQN